MDEKGVYAIARAIWDNPDFADEPYTQREAWMWLIGAAAWKEIRIRGNGGSVVLKRGEFAFSVRFLAERFGWSKSRVERFIRSLENRDTIRDTSRDGSTVYSINKYDDFQVVGLPKRDDDRDTSRDSSGTAAGQQRDKEEALQALQALQSLNVTVLRPAKAKTQQSSKPLPDWLDREAWDAFLEIRRRKRVPMTDRAFELLMSKLDRWRLNGHDPTAILDTSIASGWSNIYEPKADRNANHNKQPTANDKWLAGASEFLSDLAEGQESGDSGPADEAGRPLLSA